MSTAVVVDEVSAFESEELELVRESAADEVEDAVPVSLCDTAGEPVRENLSTAKVMSSPNKWAPSGKHKLACS